MELMEFENFGRCVKFEKNGIFCLVTVDIGPRIVYYGTNGVNFMNTDIDRNVSKDGEFFDKAYKKGEKWFLYGGHRVWKAPEDMETYVPDNYPVEYEVKGNSGSFYTKTTPFGLKYGFELKMNDDGSLDLSNRIYNYGEEREIAVWALTVAAKGGELTVPLNDKVNDLLPSQNFVIWPYAHLNDDRLCIFDGKMTLKQRDGDAFKIGLFSKKREALYELEGKVLKITFEEKKGNFVDFSCNFETYTNSHIIEIEALGPLEKVAKNSFLELKEKFEILSKS